MWCSLPSLMAFRCQAPQAPGFWPSGSFFPFLLSISCSCWAGPADTCLSDPSPLPGHAAHLWLVQTYPELLTLVSSVLASSQFLAKFLIFLNQQLKFFLLELSDSHGWSCQLSPSHVPGRIPLQCLVSLPGMFSPGIM